MRDADRYKLRFGPYRAPRCRVGRWLTCAVRGRVRVVAISDAPIPWPQCRVTRGGRPSLIVCGDLLRAIRRESNQAVAAWWGVSSFTVTKWRHAVGVPAVNEGTSKLHAEWMPERLDDEARRRLHKALRSPERGAKIAAAQRGRKRAPETVARMRRARKGFRHTPEARAKMRQALLQRHARDGFWKPEDDALLGTMPDVELAERLGRARSTVERRRYRLGVPCFRRHGPITPSRTWTRREDRLLGTLSDVELAARLGCTPRMVFNRRVKLGIPAFGKNGMTA
jgi:hypothetical protein